SCLWVIATRSSSSSGGCCSDSSASEPVKPYGVVSCHVERPLDDECWSRFVAVQARRPGGFRIAALMRPPDAGAGEDEERWLARARAAAERGPLGQHTHF